MIYTKEQIRDAVIPVARKHNLKTVDLFGSYAWGTANENSDVDLFIDTDGSGILSLFDLGAVYCDFEEALGKSIDLITKSSFDQHPASPVEEDFRAAVNRERMNLYAVA